MKITDIITESLDAKLHKIVTAMSRGMTIEQFTAAVANQHKVEFIYEPSIGADEFTVRTGVMSQAVEDQSAENKTMKFEIVGPDDQLDPNTQIKDIKSFISVYKHEMAHYYQVQSENGNSEKLHSEYINASAERWIEYFLQAKERPAMIMNINDALMDVGMTPAEYFKIIGEANTAISGQFQRFVQKHDVEGEMKAEWSEIDPSANKAFDALAFRLGKHLEASYANMLGGEKTGLYRMVKVYVFYINYYAIQGQYDLSDKLKAQFNAFKRLLLKKSKQSSAYRRDAENNTDR